MFDNFIDWLTKHPKLHVFFLTWLFFGLVLAWVFMMLPFAIYDAWRKDFDPYFATIKSIWKGRKE